MEFVQLRLAESLTTPSPDDHKAALIQNPDVPGDGRTAYPEVLRHAVEGELLSRKKTQDGSSVRIGNRLKNVSSQSRVLTVCNRLVTYICNHSVTYCSFERSIFKWLIILIMFFLH